MCLISNSDQLRCGDDEYTKPFCELKGCQVVFGSSLVYEYQMSHSSPANAPGLLCAAHYVGFVVHVLFCPVMLCPCVCVHVLVQVSEGGPSHYVLAPAEFGPGENTWSSRRALHSSV